MVFHGSKLVFHGSRSVFMFFHGSRLVFMVFHGSRSIFHGSRIVFMVFQGSRLVFHGFSWFQVGFSWFFSKCTCPNCILAQLSNLGPPPGGRHRTQCHKFKILYNRKSYSCFQEFGDVKIFSAKSWCFVTKDFNNFSVYFQLTFLELSFLR